MKCPKCNEDIASGVKFCTKCGANIEEEKTRIAEEEAKKKAEEEKKKKAAEDKKRLEEIRKQEELKKEQELKEAEKKEAIRQAKEEGIELEIIDEPVEEAPPTTEFKVKKEPKPKREKPPKRQKVKIKKSLFQRILNKIIFILVVAALIVGGVYYGYQQKLLPEFAQKEVQEFDETLREVIKLHKEVKEGKKNIQQENQRQEEIEKNNWKVEPTIEAEDIRDLTEDVSVIIKDKKAGLIDNVTGEIVLEPKYSQILYQEYTIPSKPETKPTAGIIVKDGEKFCNLNDKYEIADEVATTVKADPGTYFSEYHGMDIYYNTPDQKCSKVVADPTKKGLQTCTSIDIVTTEGAQAKNGNLPEVFSIDFTKSTASTKGYFDLATGKLKINCDYKEAYEFLNGYAAVRKGSGAGIIDEEGKEVIECKYGASRSVHKDGAFVLKDSKWGIIKIEK